MNDTYEEWFCNDKTAVNSIVIENDCVLSSLACISNSNDVRYYDYISSDNDSYCEPSDYLFQTGMSQIFSEDKNVINNDKLLTFDGTHSKLQMDMALEEIASDNQRHLQIANFTNTNLVLRDDHIILSDSPSPDISYSSSFNETTEDLNLNDGMFSKPGLPSVANFSYSASNSVVPNITPKNLCSSENENLGLGSNLCFNTRNKMHELAVKQKLITEQDPQSYGLLCLSPEEKRTLLQEGYQLPTTLPLTKSEKEALKTVRRKIKNKLSAKESRRKRKEYLDTLEQRVQCFRNENSILKLKLKVLEQNNQNLLAELQRLIRFVESEAAYILPNADSDIVI